MRALVAASLASSLVNFRGELLRELLAAGVEVHVTAPDIDVDVISKPALESWGVVTHAIDLQRTGMNPWSDLRTLVGYVRLMKSINPNFFLGYTIKPVVFGTLAAHLCAVTHRAALITGLGYGFQGGARRSVLRLVIRSLYGLSLRFASVVIFQNPDDKRAFESLGLLRAGVGAEIVNGSGVDLDRFAPKPLPEGAIRFLMIGRLLGEKGVREYVDAARLVRAEFPLARFVLVGPRDSNPNAVSKAELDAWIAEGIVDYRGELRDVRSVLADCSVYVLPSYREGTPRSVLEALATGRPVITTDAPGCRETVDDGINGFLVPVGSAQALAEAMQQFLRQPELLQRMAVASLSKARSKYDVRLVNRKMLQILGVGGGSSSV